MNKLPKEIILEILNFLPDDELSHLHYVFQKPMIEQHIPLRTASSLIHCEGDLTRARRFPRAKYTLFVYNSSIYSHLEPEEYTKVSKIYSCVYIPSIFQNLSYLNISHTDLRELPAELISLKELHCSRSNLQELPDSYSGLEVLDVSYTAVKDIPESYRNLLILNLYSSKVKELSPEFQELRDLNIGMTHIKEVPTTYTLLRKLNCQLSLVSGLSDSLNQLEWLYCSFHIPDWLKKRKLRYFILS
jgi:hypothetical protein